MSQRVLMVSGPATGGIRTHLEALVRGLPDRGLTPVYAGPASVILPEGLERYPLEIGDRPRPVKDLAAAMELRRIWGKGSYSVVHAHGLKAGLVCATSLPLAPVAVTFHNLLRPGLVTTLARKLLCDAHAVAVSEAVGASLGAVGIWSHSLSVIPNGVNTTHFHPPAEPAPGPLRAAFMGRLTEEKGVRVLLEMARQRLPARLVVAGDGPLRLEVEAAAAAGLLEYLGSVSDVASLLREVHLLVAPSFSEGQGIAVLEAMATGLPVVASRVGGLGEAVVDGVTGLLVEPGRPEELLAAMETLADDPARRAAMGNSGRLRVQAEYSLDAMLTRLATIYQRVGR